MNESKGTEHTFALSTDLVLIKPIGSRMEPYTTADTVAEYAKVKRKTVEKYFSSTSVEDSDRAYIFAVLNAVDDIVFEFSRDLDAAFGIETAEVQTFIKNTREIYGQFIDKPND